MLIKNAILFANLLLNLVGYQTNVTQFKKLLLSCQQIGANSYIEINAEILDSALFLNQVEVVEVNSELRLTFKKRFVSPQKRMFVDKILVSTASRNSVEDNPNLSAAWHRTKVNLGNLAGHSYNLKIVGLDGKFTIGQCKF